MATATAPTAVIHLDRPRKLSLDLNAMGDFEDLTGKDFLRLVSLRSAKEIRALLYVCMKADDPLLTEEQVGALVHVGNIELISAALTNLMNDAAPPALADGGNPTDPSPEAEASDSTSADSG